MKFPKLSYPSITKLPLLLLVAAIVIIGTSNVSSHKDNSTNVTVAGSSHSIQRTAKGVGPHTVHLQPVLGAQTHATDATVSTSNATASSSQSSSSNLASNSSSSISNNASPNSSSPSYPSTINPPAPNSCPTCPYMSSGAMSSCADYACIDPEPIPDPAQPPVDNTCQPCGNLSPNSGFWQPPRMCPALACIY